MRGDGGLLSQEKVNEWKNLRPKLGAIVEDCFDYGPWYAGTS